MVQQYKVVITDRAPFPDLEITKTTLDHIDAELVECKTDEDIRKHVVDADAVLVTYYEITPELVDTMERAKIISRQGIGVNNIPLAAAAKNGICVTNVPFYCLDEVSSHALALLLCCARKIPQLNSNVKSKNWDLKAQMPMLRLKGQTVGLIAYGKIGQELAKKAQGLGLNVIAHDPYVDAEEMKNCNIAKVDFATLLKESDFISIHAPLTPETKGMIGTEEFKKMRNTAYIINTARGAIINEAELVEALTANEIAGAGLDVLESEVFDPENPLLEFDNVILTPHAAFYSEGSLKELQKRAVDEVVRVLKNEKPDSCVNCDMLE